MKNKYLLDADETVLDFVRSSRESFGAAMRKFGHESAAQHYALFKEINDGLWREYERGEIRKAELVVARFSRFFARMSIEEDAAAVNREYFAKLCRTGYLLEGARSFMDELKKRGKVYLITNGTPDAQYGRLASLGLTDFFDGVFVSDEIGFAKPDARFFAYVLQHIQAEKQDCVIIGDSLTSDIKGANNAGIECVWYNVCGKEAAGAKPDHTAASYVQVLEIIDKIS